MSKRKFGEHIRAARLGWRFSHDHGCYIRISFAGSKWRVEVAGTGHVPGRTKLVTEHVCWWEGASILGYCEPLEKIRMGVPGQRPLPVEYVCYVVDDDGKIVTDDE